MQGSFDENQKLLIVDRALFKRVKLFGWNVGLF